MARNWTFPSGRSTGRPAGSDRRVAGADTVRRAACVLVSTIALVGCSSADPAKFTPEVDRAQQTLARVLDAWKAGSTIDQVEGTAVRVADTKRRPGQILKSYEILGELPSDSGRRFQVKLSLDKPRAEEKVQYLVVGIDPLWVFRQEDYDMITHWDHPMPANDTPAGSGGATKPDAQ